MRPRRLVWARGLAMALAVAAVIGLSLGGGAWAQVAGAQTVPTLTFTPQSTGAATARPTAILPTATTSGPPSVASSTPVAASATEATAAPSEVVVTPPAAIPGSPTAAAPADLAACGPGPYVVSVPLAGARAVLALPIGGLTLLGTDGLAGQSGAPSSVSRLSAQVIARDQLPPAPSDWQPVGCGLQAAATGSVGETDSFLVEGLVVCLARPGNIGADQPLRLGYFDPRAGIARWVFVPGTEASDPLCSGRFHMPALFALLTSPS